MTVVLFQKSPFLRLEKDQINFIILIFVMKSYLIYYCQLPLITETSASFLLLFYFGWQNFINYMHLLVLFVPYLNLNYEVLFHSRYIQ